MLRDIPTPNGWRSFELAPGSEDVIITLEPATPRRHPRRDRYPVHHRRHRRRARALQATGVDTDGVLRWPGAPAMFAFRDRDGNAFSITEIT